MKALALFLAVSLASPDGGTAIEYDCPAAGPVERVDGGWLISDARERRLSCLFAATEAHRDLALKQNEELMTESPSWTMVVVGILVVGIAGMTTGYLIGRRADP